MKSHSVRPVPRETPLREGVADLEVTKEARPIGFLEVDRDAERRPEHEAGLKISGHADLDTALDAEEFVAER